MVVLPIPSSLAARIRSPPVSANALTMAWISSFCNGVTSRGASVGSLTTIPGFRDLRYLVEGDKRAIQESKRLVETRERLCVTIDRGLKPYYLAALTCTGSLLFPLVMAASQSLRRAGVPAIVATSMIEKQLSLCLRSYARGGRRAYAPPAELTSQLRALSTRDPALAFYVERSCQLAEQLLERPQRVRARKLARTTASGG